MSPRRSSPNRKTGGGQLLMVLTVASIACLAFASRLLVAQGASGRTVWDGVFTEVQASRGEAAYGRSCAALPQGGPARRRHCASGGRRRVLSALERKHAGRSGANDEKLDAAGRAGQPCCAGLRRHRDVSTQGERKSHRIRRVDGEPRSAEAGPRHDAFIQVDMTAKTAAPRQVRRTGAATRREKDCRAWYAD